jgi:hypothetical protein
VLWFTVVDNQERGPFEAQELLQLLREGKITLLTSVKRDRSPLQRRLQDALFELQNESNELKSPDESGILLGNVNLNPEFLDLVPTVVPLQSSRTKAFKPIKLAAHRNTLRKVALKPLVSQIEKPESAFDRAVTASLSAVSQPMAPKIDDVLPLLSPVTPHLQKSRAKALVQRASAPAHQKPRVASFALMGEPQEKIPWKNNRINTTAHHRAYNATDLNRHSIRRTRNKKRSFWDQYGGAGIIVGFLFLLFIVSLAVVGGQRYQRMKLDLVEAESIKQRIQLQIDLNNQQALERQRAILEQLRVKRIEQKLQMQEAQAKAKEAQTKANEAQAKAKEAQTKANEAKARQQSVKRTPPSKRIEIKSTKTKNLPIGWPLPVLGTSGQLNAKLFRVVSVGPLTLMSYPRQNCSPCEAVARLSDGSNLLLVSGSQNPFAVLLKNPGKKWLAKGLLQKRDNGKLALLLKAFYPN